MLVSQQNGNIREWDVAAVMVSAATTTAYAGRSVLQDTSSLIQAKLAHWVMCAATGCQRLDYLEYVRLQWNAQK